MTVDGVSYFHTTSGKNWHTLTALSLDDFDQSDRSYAIYSNYFWSELYTYLYLCQQNFSVILVVA